MSGPKLSKDDAFKLLPSINQLLRLYTEDFPSIFGSIVKSSKLNKSYTKYFDECLETFRKEKYYDGISLRPECVIAIFALSKYTSKSEEYVKVINYLCGEFPSEIMKTSLASIYDAINPAKTVETNPKKTYKDKILENKWIEITANAFARKLLREIAKSTKPHNVNGKDETYHKTAITARFEDMFEKPGNKSTDMQDEENATDEKYVFDPCTGKRIVTHIAELPMAEPRGDMFKVQPISGQLSVEEIRAKLKLAISAVNEILRNYGIACSVRLTNELTPETDKQYETEWTNGLEPFLVSVMRRLQDQSNDGVILAEKSIYVYHIACMLARELYTKHGHGIMSSVSPNKFYIRSVDFQSSRGFELFVSPLGWDLYTAEKMKEDAKILVNDPDRDVKIAELNRLFRMQYNNEYQNTCEHFNAIFSDNNLGKYFAIKNVSKSLHTDANIEFENNWIQWKKQTIDQRLSSSSSLSSEFDPTLRSLTPSAAFNSATEDDKDINKLLKIWRDMEVCVIKAISDRLPILKVETIDDHVEYTLPNKTLENICREYVTRRNARGGNIVEIGVTQDEATEKVKNGNDLILMEKKIDPREINENRDVEDRAPEPGEEIPRMFTRHALAPNEKPYKYNTDTDDVYIGGPD